MKKLALLCGALLLAPHLQAAETDDAPTAQDLLVVPSPGTRPVDPAEAAVAETEAEAGEQKAPDDEAVEDDMVPPPFPISRYQELWERSPFQLESIAPPVESAGLAQRYALTGIAEIGGEAIAFLMERATQQRLMVKKQEGEGGLSLVQVDVIQSKYEDSAVTVRQGGEVGVVKFDAGAAMPATAMGMPQPQPQAFIPGAPGAPPVPGMPAAQQPRFVPGQAPQVAGIQPGAPGMPGAVPGVPGQGVTQNGQVQPPGQQPMPPPRVIRRRAIVPAAP